MTTHTTHDVPTHSDIDLRANFEHRYGRVRMQIAQEVSMLADMPDDSIWIFSGERVHSDDPTQWHSWNETHKMSRMRKR